MTCLFATLDHPGLVFFFQPHLFISWHYLPSQPDLTFLFQLAKILLTVERQKLPIACWLDVPNPKGTGEAATWASFFPPRCSRKPRCWHLTYSRHTLCIYAHTFLGHAIRPEKIAFSLRTAAGRRPGKSCALTDTRALQPPEKLQSTLLFFFFFFRRRGAKRGTAEGCAVGKA